LACRNGGFFSLVFSRGTGRMRAELPGPVPQVEQPGYARAQGGAYGPNGKPFSMPLKEDPDDDQHLGNRCQLAEDSGLDFYLANHHLDHDQPDQQEDVSPDNGSGEPQWDWLQVRPMIKAQQDDARDQQQFIGQRIQKRSQFASLIVAARNVAVHAI